MKCHYPDVFAAALLNSQPMGFYAPAQLVRDAREHGVEVRDGRRQLCPTGIARWSAFADERCVNDGRRLHPRHAEP